MALPVSEALILLGRWLGATGYEFITVTPATHARVMARDGLHTGQNLRDVFGWSRPFAAGLLPAKVLDWLREGGLLEESAGLLRSQVRFSSLQGQLYAHSAFPTLEADAVFFGPDTYRFAALIESELAAQPLAVGARILDIGCGGGPGGMAAARFSQASQPRLWLADINPRALAFAHANAALAGLAEVRFQQSDLYQSLAGSFDLIVSNPPYLVDLPPRRRRAGQRLVRAHRAGRPGAAGTWRAADCLHRRAHRAGKGPVQA